jgi:hypothetical protein
VHNPARHPFDPRRRHISIALAITHAYSPN